jgi:hypothetical protein
VQDRARIPPTARKKVAPSSVRTTAGPRLDQLP